MCCPRNGSGRFLKALVKTNSLYFSVDFASKWLCEARWEIYLRDPGGLKYLPSPDLQKSVAAAFSFLSATNVMRTRYAHQVTVVVLDILIKRAYEVSGSQMRLEDI